MLNLWPFKKHRESAMSKRQTVSTGCTHLLHAELPKPGGGTLDLRVDFLEVPRMRRFLEDTENRLVDGRREILCADKGRVEIRVSRDLGQTWERLIAASEIGLPVRRCHTLSNGWRIIQIGPPSQTLVLDEEWNVISRQHVGNYFWHGTCSIAQSATGTVMFAEYRTTNEDREEPIHVWRKLRDSDRWEPVLTKIAGNRPPAGDIRHFHTCMADPKVPGRWYVTSGDILEHNRFWVSEDDGESWREVTANLSPADAVANGKTMRAFRFTSALFEGDTLLWPTDDDLGTGASALISAQRFDPTMPMKVLCRFGPNLMRSILSIDDELVLVMSESKRDTSESEWCLVDRQGMIGHSLRVANLTGEPCPVTASMGTHRVIDGVAFFPSFGRILTKTKGGILRFSFE